MLSETTRWMDLDKQSSPRVLIVDDTPDNIRVLGTILRQQDYQINVAQNGVQALNLTGKIMPDLILLDIMMPELDGLETCRRLKQDPITRDIPVIFLSAKAEDEDVLQGFELGAADYVTKPFNPRILLARVKTHIALRQQTKQLQAFADRDGLTLLANRRRFDEFMRSEWRRCHRAQAPLSLVMIDIDYFKLYNDAYGHLKGDDTLKQVAQVLAAVGNRPTDLPARFGGEEFSVLYGNTDHETATRFAQDIRAHIEALQIPHSDSKVSNVVTASLGVATQVPDDQHSPLLLIEEADTKLYAAKEAGRNRVQE